MPIMAVLLSGSAIVLSAQTEGPDSEQPNYRRSTGLASPNPAVCDAGRSRKRQMGGRPIAERCHLGGAVWLRMAASASATSRRLTSSASVLRTLETGAPAAIRGTTERWW